MDMLRDIALNVGYGLIIAIIVFLFLGVGWFFLWKRRQNTAYGNYNAIVWKTFKTDNGEIPMIVGTDKGIIKKDSKMKKWVFHLKKFNVDLGDQEEKEGEEVGKNVKYDLEKDDIPAIPMENGQKMVFIEQLSPRRFAIGNPFIFDGDVNIRVTSADEAEAMRSYDMNARFWADDKLKWLPHIIFAILAIMIIILIAVTVNKFDVIKESMEIAAQIAQSNNAAAVAVGG